MRLGWSVGAQSLIMGVLRTMSALSVHNLIVLLTETFPGESGGDVKKAEVLILDACSELKSSSFLSRLERRRRKMMRAAMRPRPITPPTTPPTIAGVLLAVLPVPPASAVELGLSVCVPVGGTREDSGPFIL